MATDLDNWNLEKWLKRLGLRKYKQGFLDNGYDTPDLCANLNKEDMDAIGVSNKQHRGTLFTQARKLLALVDKEAWTASAEVIDRDEAINSKSSQSPSPKFHTAASGHTPPPPPRSGPPASQPSVALPDYSEPWNSKVAATSPAKAQTLKPTAGEQPSDIPDGPSPVHRKGSGQGSGQKGVSASRKKLPPLSPGAELPAYKREGSFKLTRLQLKLKIREELFSRGVLLTEPPYCWEDGSADEQAMMDLTEELAEKFSIESLELFDALQEVWSNANKSDFATSRKTKVRALPKGPTDTYDEPFDTIGGATPTTPTSVLKPSPPARLVSPRKKSSTLPQIPSDNYDEPFDTIGSATPTIPTPTIPTSVLKPSPPARLVSPKKKSSTLPQTPSDNYDEPFDTVAVTKSPPSPPVHELVRVESSQSQTLPSPSRQRRSVDDTADGRHTPTTKPSPSHPKNRFKLFKRKEKARSQSVRESDVSYLEGGKKLGVLSFPKNSSEVAKHVSAENISDMGVSPSNDQIAYLMRGVSPPVPSPRSSEDSDQSPALAKTKKHKGKVFKKFITPPTLLRNQVGHLDDCSLSSAGSTDERRRMSGVTMDARLSSSTIGLHRTSKGSDDDTEEKSWMMMSKSFDDLNTITRKLESDTGLKKRHTTNFISRLFKRRSVIPSSQKRSGGGKSAKVVSERGSIVSNGSAVMSEIREHCLTASMSMPDITNSNLVNRSLHKPPDTPPDNQRPPATPHNNGYAEVFDAIKPSPDPARYSPKANTFHRSPKVGPSKLAGQQQSSPVRPLRVIRPPEPTSPQQSSPVVISPPPSHQKIFIRGSSESSGPDNITITLGPDSAPTRQQGSEVVDAVVSPRSGSADVSRSGSAVSTQSARIYDSEDALSSRFGTSAGSEVLDEPWSRVGSASSTASSEMSVGSLTRKPPTLPKPRLLSTKPRTAPSPTHKAEPGPTHKAEPGPTHKAEPATSKDSPSRSVEPAKPPKKPSRGMSHKIKPAKPNTATPSASTATPTSAMPTSRLDGRGASPVVSPSRVTPFPWEGRVSPRPVRSSAPSGPPKPARMASVRVKSESNGGTPDVHRTPDMPSRGKEEVLSLADKTPPPKPSRRGKSVKIADPLSDEDKSRTLRISSRPARPAPPKSEGTGYASTTLPHHFKVGGQGETSVKGSGGSTSPKPVPRPRVPKNPEGDVRTARKEVSAK